MLRRVKPIHTTLLALLIVPVLHLLYVLSQWHHIPLHNGLPIGQTDPDTWLRLTLVREWLSGGGWYNHLVPNSNAPWVASASPWTRPVDMVLAFFVSLQPDTLDLSTRLMRASLLLPCLWLALLIAGIHRLLRVLCPLPSAYFMATALVASNSLMLNYFGLGNADHHAPLAVLFIWAMAGILAPAPTRRLMVLSGFLLGLQMWVSVEVFLLIGIIYGWYGLLWLRGDFSKATAFAWLATATALTSVAAVMIEVPPHAWFAPVYDSISVVYAHSLVIAALVAWVLRAFTPTSLQGRIGGAMGCAVALVCAIGSLFPHVPQGPLYGVHPFIISDFLPRISEARSVLHSATSMLLVCSYLPVAVIILCLMPWLCPRYQFYVRAQSALIGYFLVATLLLYFTQQRWSYYLLPLAFAFAAPLLGALLTPEHPLAAHRWPARWLRPLSPNQQMARRLPVLVVVFFFPTTVALLAELPAFNSENSTQYRINQQRDDCYRAARQLLRSGELNRVLPTPLTLWAPTDLGTEILFFTPHRIIASNYHREGEAIQYLWNTNKIANPNNLRAHLAERKVGAMLICPLVEFSNDSLTQTYAMGGQLPAWLEPIPYQLPAAPEKEAKADAVLPVKPILVKVKTS